MTLPAVAHRNGRSSDEPPARLTIPLPSAPSHVPFPAGMDGPLEMSVPQALLLPCAGPFDILLANQIAVLSELAVRIRASPRAWIAGLLSRRRMPLTQRIGAAFARVHSTADVHPTAVLEGVIVGPGARIGAHCVVRWSVIGAEARLHDGAKVELSVVGARTWLMHDLVLYRSVTEDEVFLIHGPYQFSYFQRHSAAFATIMMDYRPDGKPFPVPTVAGARSFAGRFLGAVVGEGAKVLGGCLLAPGRIVPPGVWLSPDPQSIHVLGGGLLPQHTPLHPELTRRRTDEPARRA